VRQSGVTIARALFEDKAEGEGTVPQEGAGTRGPKLKQNASIVLNAA